MRYICTAIVAPLFAAGISQAATIYVPDDYPNIYQAVAVAIDGDVIEVAAGTYLGSISQPARKEHHHLWSTP